MTQRYQKSPHIIQFGTPHDVHSRQGLIHGDISINFNKFVRSWFNFKGILPSKSNPEEERLGNSLPTLVQVSKCSLIRKDNKQTRSRAKNDQRILYVDLNKLDKNRSLNKDDKKRLKYILNELKCDNLEKKTFNRSSYKTNKPSVANKVHKPIQRDKTTVKHKKPQSNINNKIKSSRCRSKNINKYLKCSECKLCSDIMNKKEKQLTRKQRVPTMITLSDQRLFQTLIELDPICYGDTIENLCDSSGVLNSIINDNKNINIKNIELKYLNPTYVVQYNTADDNNTLPRPFRERHFSTATMDAHLGRRPSMAVRGEHDHEKFVNFEPSDHRIGLTKEMKQEEMRAEEKKPGSTRKLNQTSNTMSYAIAPKLEKKADKDHIIVEDPAIIISGPPSPKLGAGKWPQEKIPSYLLVTEQPKMGNTREDPKKKESTCKAITQCLRKCLGFSNEKDKGESNTTDPIETPMSKMDKTEYIQQKKFSSNVVVDIPPAITINKANMQKKGQTSNIKKGNEKLAKSKKKKNMVKFKSNLETN